MSEKMCPVCGKSFWPSRSFSKYCSKRCRNDRNNQKVLDRYYEKRGIPPHSDTRTNGAYWTMYKMRYEPCIRCGFVEIVILHDIIPASEGGDRRDPSNRIPLCPNCHGTLHKDIWKIWELEDKLNQDYRYFSQLCLIQILKQYNHQYRPYGGKTFAERRNEYEDSYGPLNI